ncbi:MAG: heavy metal translocating P-type ATPase [Eubacterium sp.]|nr:heavy metal translocating P-type ATPase [Eubacterium sp.]
MKCRLLHETRGRMRVRAIRYRMTVEQADRLEFYLKQLTFVEKASVNERSMDAVIYYQAGAREDVIRALSEYDEKDTEVAVPEHTGRELRRDFESGLFFTVARRCVTRFLLPAPLSIAYNVIRSVPFIIKGIRSLIKGRIDVAVLDATAISVSMITGDYTTAGSIMFLLDIGQQLENWTYRKSVDDLAQRMMLNVDQVWIRTEGNEVLVPVNQVQPGDLIVVRTGNLIPLDGIVTSGDASINQASMTGESIPVHKTVGGYVYAGTVVEEGELEVSVKQAMGFGKYDRIVSMIEDSERLKSATESRAAHLADRLVPWSLGATLIAGLVTGSMTKALSILMVDYSCALKLAMPISVLSAMRECSDHHINVKGGKFLEAVSDANTLVFDKTGTLTHASPHVREIVVFEDRDPDEMLRLAACLEEHFPHSIAKAVVEEAKRKSLRHEERHTKVEYVVAHGIVSAIDGARVLIGSQHFVFEDEQCVIPEDEQMKYEALPADCSLLYLAIDGRLAAVLCIEDPIRREAAEVIDALHDCGIDRIVMMTGDSERTAAAVAEKIKIDAFYAEVLPEDKAAFIRAEHDAGRKVIMVGDGINDSVALSEADAGIAISDGAALAREIADITISADSLQELVTLRRIGNALTARNHMNYRKIMGFNTVLIVLGLAGFLPAATSALLHNASTLVFSLQSMQDLL